MEILIVFLVLVFVIAFVIQKTAKFLLNKIQKKKEFNNNPYIHYHLDKVKNDRDYKDYINWLDKENMCGVPINKIVAKEDQEATKKIKRLFL